MLAAQVFKLCQKARENQFNSALRVLEQPNIDEEGFRAVAESFCDLLISINELAVLAKL